MNFELKAVGTLWVAGQVNPKNFGDWGIIGVFTTEKRAKVACVGTCCFVAPLEINKAKDPTKTVRWPGAYLVPKKAKKVLPPTEEEIIEGLPYAPIHTKYC